MKDILTLLADFCTGITSDVFYNNYDFENLDDTHIYDAESVLGKMRDLMEFCKRNNYASDKIICIDVGYDYEGIHSIHTLKEESEY